MPRPGRMTTDRAKDFKGSLLRVAGVLGPHKFTLAAVLLFAVGSTVFSIVGPKVLAKATTALATLDPHGRERGILAGANVVMPNLSPREVRYSYALYDHKANSGCEAAEGLQRLRDQLHTIGCDIVVSRGDAPS